MSAPPNPKDVVDKAVLVLVTADVFVVILVFDFLLVGRTIVRWTTLAKDDDGFGSWSSAASSSSSTCPRVVRSVVAGGGRFLVFRNMLPYDCFALVSFCVLFALLVDIIMNES